MGSKQKLETDKETDELSTRNGKPGRPIVLGRQKSWFDLKELKVGFCQRGRGRSFHVEGPKTEKAREPAVEM